MTTGAKNESFTVVDLMSTASGNYAGYISKSGIKTWAGNFGFKKGDKVEMFDFDGYCPSKIIVNGIVTWTEEDKKEWYESYSRAHKELLEKYTK